MERIGNQAESPESRQRQFESLRSEMLELVDGSGVEEQIREGVRSILIEYPLNTARIQPLMRTRMDVLDRINSYLSERKPETMAARLQDKRRRYTDQTPIAFSEEDNDIIGLYDLLVEQLRDTN